jgi:hypothetical protein
MFRFLLGLEPGLPLLSEFFLDIKDEFPDVGLPP